MAAKGRTNFLEYDWTADGERALVTVDLALYDNAPDAAFPCLAVLTCRSARMDAALSKRELRGGEALAGVILKKLRAVFAGRVETVKICRYYFYLADEAEQEKAEALLKKARHVNCELEFCSDERWRIYFHTLYPDDARMQTVYNKEIIETLYKNGDSDAPRRLNIHAYLPSEAQRLRFADAALREGFAVGEAWESDESELPYGVVLHRVCPLEKQAVDEVTSCTIRLLNAFGGRFGFWDCPIVPRRGR